MTGLLARARFILGALAICVLHRFARAAHAQQPGPPVDPDASVGE